MPELLAPVATDGSIPLWTAPGDGWDAKVDAVLHIDGPAPCEVEPDSWWPTQGESPDELARRICADCPARPECLAYALAADEREGVWGGLTPAQRVRLATRVAA